MVSKLTLLKCIDKVVILKIFNEKIYVQLFQIPQLLPANEI